MVACGVFLLLSVVGTLVVSTPEDMVIRREIAFYDRTIQSLEDGIDRQKQLVGKLEAHDAAIYSRLFGAGVHRLDSLPATADSTYAAIQDILKNKADSLPPLLLPLAQLSWIQTAASVGNKLNPFYELPEPHRGVDLIAAEGTPVLCTAPGVVTSVGNARDGIGMTVNVKHNGGYVTRYGRLGETFVEKGDKVVPGDTLGTVGAIAGFATHLHYEVLHRATVLDPVDLFGATLGAEEYAKMKFISTNTNKSMD